MNPISNLKNIFDVEHVAQSLFELIKNRTDNSVSNELFSFDDNILPKSILVTQKLISFKNFNSKEFLNTKSELESYNNDIIKFKKVFQLLDQKLDNEINNNQNLSKEEKEELQQGFLFDVRQKYLDLSISEKQYTNILTLLNDKLKNKTSFDSTEPVAEKQSFLDRIKSLRVFSHDSTGNKNKLN